MPKRRCVVTFQDAEGIEHAAVVEADSVWEAAARALAKFHGDSWSNDGAHWTGALNISAVDDGVAHKVVLEKFRDFLTRSGGNPRDIKLNAIIEGK